MDRESWTEHCGIAFIKLSSYQPQVELMGYRVSFGAFPIRKQDFEKVFWVWPLGWGISKTAVLDHLCTARTKRGDLKCSCALLNLYSMFIKIRGRI